MEKNISYFADDMSENKEFWLKWELKPYKQKAWITFFDDEYEKNWYPITLDGKHLDFHSTIIMEIARSRYGGKRYFGISYCSQKELGNAVRDNF